MRGNGKSKAPICFAVVDGDPLVTEALQMGLEEQGGFALVAACANGRQALEVLPALPRNQRPDLVLLEIRLPEVDGYTVCRALRGSCPDLLTAFHTTHRLPCFVNGARHAGADAYFCKPMAIHQLAKELRELHRTNCLLIDPSVLLGGQTGHFMPVQEPGLSPRMEAVLELEAKGWPAKQIAEHFQVCHKMIYQQKREALARVERACAMPESR